MVFETTLPQEPEPLVTFAVCEATPLVGRFAVKITFVAGSPPGGMGTFAMSNVKATGVPATGGLGEGLLLAAVSLRTLLAPSLVTNAS
jgi:hypothetical protein